MWETIKNDPVLKSITILVLGVLSFGLAFNIMFGRNTGGMEAGMDMGGGYSLSNTLAYILSISIKLLLIGLVIAAIILLVKVIKRYLIEGNEFKMFESIKVEEIKKDPVLKTALIAIAAVLGLVLITIIFNSVFSPYGYSRSYGMLTNGYISPQGNIARIFGKLLLYVSVIGVLVSLIAYVRQSNISVDLKNIIISNSTKKPTVLCEVCNYGADQEYKYCPSCGKQRIQECVHCASELKAAWQCCPSCGTDVNIVANEIDTVLIEKVDENNDENMPKIEIEEEKVIEYETTEKTEIPVITENKTKYQKPYEKKQKKQR